MPARNKLREERFDLAYRSELERWDGVLGWRAGAAQSVAVRVYSEGCLYPGGSGSTTDYAGNFRVDYNLPRPRLLVAHFLHLGVISQRLLRSPN